MPEMSEEEAQAMKEKLKNMSPEELKEFQKQQCIFCQIIHGKVQSKKIYEDEKCLAVLDINPANPGHLVLMPKEHYAIMPVIPPEQLGHLAVVSKALSHVLLNTLKAEGTDIFIANGTAAGQRAQHFMVHIIPRKDQDGVGMDIPQNKISEEKINEIREKINQRIAEGIGSNKKTVEIEKEPKKEEEKKDTRTKKERLPEKSEKGSFEDEASAEDEAAEEKVQKNKKAQKSQGSLEEELGGSEDEPEEKEESEKSEEKDTEINQVDTSDQEKDEEENAEESHAEGKEGNSEEESQEADLDTIAGLFK